MADIVITSNGTVEGTKMTVDGKDVTKKEKVVSIDMYAMSPYKSSYDGSNQPGHVCIGYDVAQEDGTIQSKRLSSGSSSATKGIGQKVKMADQVIQFVGADGDIAITTLVDKIITHCEENKVTIPSRESLMVRSEQSLTDKALDLGVKLEDDA